MTHLFFFPQTDPNNVNLGVGLGLPGLKPGIENKALVANALINRSTLKLFSANNACDLITIQGQHTDRAADDGGQDQGHRLGGDQRGDRGAGGQGVLLAVVGRAREAEEELEESSSCNSHQWPGLPKRRLLAQGRV